MHTEDATWLRLIHGRSEHSLCDQRRYADLVDQLPSPSKQTPSLTFFLGNEFKDKALRQIFPQNSIGRKRSRASLNSNDFTLPPVRTKSYADASLSLRCDETTLQGGQDQHPIFFADCDPTLHPVIFSSDNPHSRHEPQTIPLSWTSGVEYQIFDTVLARCLFLFTDVVCLFSDDVGGAEGVRSLLSTWADLSNRACTQSSLRPFVLIITHGRHQSTEQENHRLIPHDAHIERHFAGIKFLELPQQKTLSRASSLRLKEDILSLVEQSRRRKAVDSLLFSAKHQVALFEAALAHVARTRTEPFDPIRAARRFNAIGDEAVIHLENFLTLTQRKNIPTCVVVSMLASSTLMDAYPTGMHPFCPRMVYETLYRPLYLIAIQRVYGSASFAEGLCTEIEEQMVIYWSGETGVAVMSELRIRTSRENSTYWKLMKTNQTCLACCISRKPEHPMACDHSICDACVLRFGHETSGFDHQFFIEACVLCGDRTPLVARLKPPTAGIRILTIDGGGTRGIVPLEILGLMQNRLGPECPIQDLFDLTFGTSTGGLIVLMLSTRRWHIKRCIAVFKSLARKLFPHHRATSSRFSRIIRCWLSDEMYDAKAFEDELIEHFGGNERLLGFRPKVPSGVKIAVTATATATTTRDGKARIFTNYNGSGRRSGYRIERPEAIDSEPLVWQAARATSAAPMLFRPLKIGRQTFLDGGLTNNNPTEIALSESRCVWPELDRPDVVLSLGTGTRQLSSPVSPGPEQSWFWHLLQTFSEMTDGEVAWKNLLNRLDPKYKQGFLRLNVQFPGPVPLPNDVESIDRLSRTVHSQHQAQHDITEGLLALLISCFYFELDGFPQYESGHFLCRGFIRGRARGAAIANALIRIYPHAIELFNGINSLGFMNASDICLSCSMYRRPVHFFVKASEPVNMCIRWDMQSSRNLSALPKPLSWYIERQQLHNAFGSSHYPSARRYKCSVCHPQSPRQKKEHGMTGRKRKREETEDKGFNYI